MEETGRTEIQSEDEATMTATSADFEAISIDKALPDEGTTADLRKEEGYPYCMQIGSIVVESVFAPGERTIQDCVKEYLLHIKES